MILVYVQKGLRGPFLLPGFHSEPSLHVRLFHRSKRSITLTAEGTLFLERCRRVLSEVTAAESELSGLAGSPRGRLRVGTPVLGDLMMPVFEGVMERYPEVELDIHFCDRMVDVIGEGFDAVIRTGEQTDSRLTARRLGPCAHVLVASSTYLKRHGVPTYPREPERHSCLLQNSPRPESWSVGHCGSNRGDLC